MIIALVASSMGSMANAITGNPQPDTNRANVGLVIFYSFDESAKLVINALSSGVLIGQNKVLTAAHVCVTSNFVVTFDNKPKLFNTYNELTLDELITKYDGTKALIYSPQASNKLDGKNGAPFVMKPDVALLILNENVPTTVVDTFASLPKRGHIDTLKAKDTVYLVGYGVQEHLTPRNLGLDKTWTGILERNSAQAKLISENFAWSDEFIRCSANPGQGKGGIAFGDSGGPVFLGETNIVLALNSYVTNSNCVGETYHTRLDSLDILKWISEVNK